MSIALDTTVARNRTDRLYLAVRAVARFWLWFFFKAVDVRHPERVPEWGPVLLCINHPNTFIDSLLVGAALGRKVHYLATAALFRSPLLGRFLAACGAIPVYRKQDDPPAGGTRLADPAPVAERNAGTFAACREAFERGRVVAIYPEGTTHAEARVVRIKTGAARMALAYVAERPGALRVVPVGLSFEARKSFRGGVLVRELMEARGLAPDRIDLVRLSRAIVDAVNHFRARDPERVERLWQRIQSYRALLAEYRVKDEAVHARLRHPGPRHRIRRGWEALAGFPLFVYGACVNAAVYWLPRWVARRMSRKETDYATWRFLASIVAYPLFWGLETWIVWRLAGASWAAAFAVSLPLSGVLAYRYWVGAGRLRSRLRFASLALTREHAARRLVVERQEILAELERAKTDYLSATKGSSF